MVLSQVVEKVAYLLCKDDYLEPSSKDDKRREYFECALRLLNRQQLDDVLQERVQKDLCCNLRCVHPTVSAESAKMQLSRKLDFRKIAAKLQNPSTNEEDK
jgi:hypothetical protein